MDPGKQPVTIDLIQVKVSINQGAKLQQLLSFPLTGPREWLASDIPQPA